MGSDKKTEEKKRKYNMSPEAYYQRTVAALKRGTTSKVWEDIINREDETGEWKELFMKYQRLLLDFVKELNKYKHVSADTKANLLKALVDEKKPLDVPVIELPKKGEEQNVEED